MSSFRLTKEQLEFGALTREFCNKRVYPVTRQLDDNGFPDELISELADLGYLGAPIPEEYGGMGIDSFALVCMIEEFARANAGLATLVAAHLSLGSKTVELFGSEEQKQKYLTLPRARSPHSVSRSRMPGLMFSRYEPKPKPTGMSISSTAKSSSLHRPT